MKKVLTVALVLLSFVSVAVATEGKGLKLSEFSLGSGKGAFTSGLEATARFGSEQYAFEFTGNSDRFYGVAFWKSPVKGLSVGICAGAFKNQPQTGPYFMFAPVKFAYVFYWRGWGFGTPNNPGWDVHPFFESVGGGLKLGAFKASLIWMNFQGVATWIPGVSANVGLTKNVRLSAGMDYKMLTDEPMFWVRVGYFPK